MVTRAHDDVADFIYDVFRDPVKQPTQLQDLPICFCQNSAQSWPYSGAHTRYQR